MAKKTKKSLSESEITSKLKKLTQDAENFCKEQIAAQQSQGLRDYNREPYKDDATIVNRSTHVTSLVQQKVDGGTSTVVRVFDSSDRVVEFLPREAEDEALAAQMTDVCNYIVRDKNTHAATVWSWVFNGFLTGIGITWVDFTVNTKSSLPRILKGVTEEQLVELTAKEDAGELSIEEASQPYSPPLPFPQANPMQAMQTMNAPKLYDLKVRSLKKRREMKIVNLPPEDFIVSKNAQFNPQTGGITADIQGHRRIITRDDLIELGFDREKVESIPKSEDSDSPLAIERARRFGAEQGEGENADNVTVYELYTTMKCEGDTARDYHFTLAGDLSNNPVLLQKEETSEYYPYAAFTPYPIANTLFGRSVSDRIGKEQVLTSKFSRHIFDNLAKSINPPMAVNQDVVNMDDLLNIHANKILRVEGNPSGAIDYIQTPFSAGQAMPIIESINASADMITGFGGTLMAVNASDLQNTTATAASQRINQLNTPVEMICRHFADTGYRYLFKIIIDLLVRNPEDAAEYIKRLTNQYTELKVDAYDPDMDIRAVVAFGVLNKDGNRMDLAMIKDNQVQAMSMGLPFVTPQNLYATNLKLAENAGFKNAGQFFTDPATIPAAPQQDPPPDPIIRAAEIEADQKREKEAMDREFEWRKAILENDLERDRMAQELELKRVEIEAKYSAQVNVERIKLEQAVQRNDMEYAVAAQTTQQELARQQTELIAKARAEQEQAAQQQAAMQQQQMAQMQAQQMPPQGPMGPMGGM